MSVKAFLPLVAACPLVALSAEFVPHTVDRSGDSVRRLLCRGDALERRGQEGLRMPSEEEDGLCGPGAGDGKNVRAVNAMASHPFPAHPCGLR